MSVKSREALYRIKKALEQAQTPPVSTYAPYTSKQSEQQEKQEIKSDYTPLPLYKPERNNTS